MHSPNEDHKAAGGCANSPSIGRFVVAESSRRRQRQQLHWQQSNDADWLATRETLFANYELGGMAAEEPLLPPQLTKAMEKEDEDKDEDKDEDEDEDEAGREEAWLLRVDDRVHQGRWLELISGATNHFHLMRKRKLFKQLVYKGVPDALRSRVWRLMLHRHHTHCSLDYKRALACARQTTPKAVIDQIDLSVKRTLRSLSFYRKRYGPQQASLFSILLAYSRCNPEVWHWAGITNFVAVLLFKLQDESETFSTLCDVMHNAKRSLHTMYSIGKPKLARLLDQYAHLERKLLPTVYENLHVKHNITIFDYAYKWIFMMFVNCVPFSLTLRIWDAYLAFGDCVLAGAALHLVNCRRETLANPNCSKKLLLSLLNEKMAEDAGGCKDNNLAMQSVKQFADKCRQAGINAGYRPPPPLPPPPEAIRFWTRGDNN